MPSVAKTLLSLLLTIVEEDARQEAALEVDGKKKNSKKGESEMMRYNSRGRAGKKQIWEELESSGIDEVIRDMLSGVVDV